MRKIVKLIVCLIASGQLHSQVSVNTDGSSPHSSAMLEVKSNNKGFLPPRMGWPQIKAIQDPAAGLVVYDEGIKALRMYDGVKWIVLGAKEYELTDPPGNFSNITASRISSFFTSSITGLGIGTDKRVCISLLYRDSLFIGNDTFGVNNFYDFLFLTFDSSGNYLWGKTFGTSNVSVSGVTIDASGNILVFGNFGGTVDFDLGTGTDNHTVAATSPFITKYDPGGNFIWAKGLTSSASASAYSSDVMDDGAGNILLTGTFSGTLDTDPGAGTQNLVSSSMNDIFLAKYDNNGNWVWSKKIGGATGNEYFPSFILLNGTIVLTAVFDGIVDADPSAATFNLTSAGGADVFFARYDAAGSFLWAKRIGGTGVEDYSRLASDPSGNIFLAVNFTGTLDIDPDGGTVNVLSAGSADFYIAKYTSAGALFTPSWYIKIGNTGDQRFSDLKTDNVGNVYVTGSLSSSASFNPAMGSGTLTSLGGTDGFLAKYSPAAVFLFAKSMGGPSGDEIRRLAVNPAGNLLYAGGYTQSTPWKSFNGDRVFSFGFFLSRYEE